MATVEARRALAQIAVAWADARFRRGLEALLGENPTSLAQLGEEADSPSATGALGSDSDRRKDREEAYGVWRFLQRQKELAHASGGQMIDWMLTMALPFDHDVGGQSLHQRISVSRATLEDFLEAPTPPSLTTTGVAQRRMLPALESLLLQLDYRVVPTKGRIRLVPAILARARFDEPVGASEEEISFQVPQDTLDALETALRDIRQQIEDLAVVVPEYPGESS